MIPKIIQLGNFSDHRGIISCVNDFSFTDIERFYIIINFDENSSRAWQGNKLEAKSFHCLSCSFKIHFIKIDNWGDLLSDLRIETIFIPVSKSKIVHISVGYANAIQSLEKNSKLISFCTLSFSGVSDGNVRYPSDYLEVNG